MTRQDLPSLLEQSLNVPPASIDESHDLKSLKQWDSMAVVTFIVTVDEHLGSPRRTESMRKGIVCRMKYAALCLAAFFAGRVWMNCWNCLTSSMAT